jgi:heme a synthase
MVVGALVIAQATAGWLMVRSGLIDVPHVSTYRLALHLLLAFAIFGVLLRTALERPSPLALHETNDSPALSRATRALALLVVAAVASGAAMAGTRGGYLFATFPTMNGAWIPDGLYRAGARAAFEDPLTAHFNHRALALLVVIATSLLAIAARGQPLLRRRVGFLIAAVALQITLGALTVTLHVPLVMAVAHQLGGLVVFAAGIALVTPYRRAAEALDGPAAAEHRGSVPATLAHRGR